MAGVILDWSSPKGNQGSLSFSVVLAETHDFISTVTTHPVDRGANVADHVRPELPTLSLSVFVSNAPIEENPYGRKVGRIESKVLPLPPPPPPLEPTQFLNPAGAVTKAVSAAIKTLTSGGPTKVQVLTFPEKDFVREVYDELVKARSDASLFTVATAKAAYVDMVLTKLTMLRAADDGTGATMQLEFAQIRKVEVKFTNAPIPTAARARTKKPIGPVAPTPAEPAQAKKATLLYASARGVGLVP